MDAVKICAGIGGFLSVFVSVVMFCDFWKYVPGLYPVWFGLRRWIGHAAYDGSPETYGMVFRGHDSVELVKDPLMARIVRDYKSAYRRLREEGKDKLAAREQALRWVRANLPKNRHQDWPYGDIVQGESP
ncbi:hypothetical protein [Rhizobium sp. BK176]|uniref:hypothetical protein n=1 Tax=Rhizobium sp. BK176 TaxID=2587071 RepID=UPI0021699B1E|nr:hypothetical protein [Rhizobium sp. BK176]MCS4090096.1 hypothetical protein [Rhizobium sp. BK176]